MGLVVTFITKCFTNAENIFEKPEKVTAHWGGSGKKDELINIVLGSTFQAIPKVAHPKAISETKQAALQQFSNVELDKERIRALGATMGPIMTRNDLIEMSKIYDSFFKDQSVFKIPFPNLLVLSPSGIAYAAGIRTDFRTVGAKSPNNPTTTLNSAGKGGLVTMEEFNPSIHPVFYPFCAKGGNSLELQCPFYFGDSGMPNYYFRTSDSMSLTTDFFAGSLQMLQEINASNMQYFPADYEYYLKLLCECQKKVLHMVYILTEERQKKFISASVVHGLARRLLDAEVHDLRTLPSVEALIMSQSGMRGMPGTFALEQLYLSGEQRSSRTLNLIVSAFYAFHIPPHIGLPAAFTLFQQECRKINAEIPPSHPLFPTQSQRIEVFLGALNEVIELLTAGFPTQQSALMDLRESLEIVAEKPNAMVTHIGDAINDFVTKSKTAAHVGPIPEAASVFAAYPQLNVTAQSPQKVGVPKKAAEVKGDQLKKGEASPKTGQAETRTGNKSKFLPPDEYKEMLKNLSPEERAKLDRERDLEAMLKFNDSLKRLGVDAKRFLEKSRGPDGGTLCHLKRSGRGDELVFVDKSLKDKMDEKEGNALRRLIEVSLRHHGIVKPKTAAEKVKNRVMMAASWHRSREDDQFADLNFDGDESEDENSAVSAEASTVNEDRLRATEQRLADAEQKTRLLEEQHRLELERLRQAAEQKAQAQQAHASGHTFMASAHSPPQSPMPMGAQLPLPQQFGPWGAYGPPQLHPGMFQQRRDAEEAYWASGAGGGHPSHLMMPHMMQHMMPHMMQHPNFQQPYSPLPTHGQVPVSGPAVEEAFSNLDESLDEEEE